MRSPDRLASRLVLGSIVILSGVLLGSRRAEAQFADPFAEPPPNAFGWITLNPDTGHTDGPFAMPGAPNPLGYPVLDPTSSDWAGPPPNPCGHWHLHGAFNGHVDPAPGPPASQSSCGHGGLVYLLGPEAFTIDDGTLYCPITFVEGRFQPTQGVWQDDPVFADFGGKQISQPHVYRPEYVAELPMIRRRDAYLVGTERPVGGAAIQGARNSIFLRGLTSGTNLIPAHIRFTLREGGATTWTHDDPTVHNLPFGQPCGIPNTFNAEIDAGNGIPAAGAPFVFTAEGDYELEAELILENGTPTGIKATVQGRALDNLGVRALFVPVVLSGATDVPATRRSLHELAQTIALFAEDRVPDWYPIETGSFQTDVSQTSVIITNETWLQEQTTGLKEPFRTSYRATLRGDLLRTLMAHAMARRAHLAGNERTLLLLDRRDYNLVDPEGPQAVGLAASTKVIFIAADALDKEKLVAHEIAHTVPKATWPTGVPGSDPACGVVYHNGPTPVAHGLRIRDRQRMDGVTAVMGPDTSSPTHDVWIAQCTYWHLANNLPILVDPPVILASGYIQREGTSILGGFSPLYQIDGVPDLEAGAGGDFALVLRDGAGVELGRYPFEPLFQLAGQGEERDLVPFMHEIPDLPGASQLDLVGPDGLLEAREYSVSAPSVALVQPASDGGGVSGSQGRAAIEWSAADIDGDLLFHSVLYSPDAGQSWVGVASDQLASQALIPIDPDATDHRVRVLTSDGARSAATERGFTLGDGDGDGVVDAFDTCPAWPDADQGDVDDNGIGDACECGDQTGDGRVNVSDVLAINEVIFELQAASPLCDTNDDDLCNVADILGANGKIFGQPAYCARFPAP